MIFPEAAMKLTAYPALPVAGTDEFTGYLRSIELLKEAGFDGYDFALFANMPVRGTVFHGPDYLLYAKRLRAEADKLGLTCNQIHAPFYGYCTEGLTRAEFGVLLLRAFEIASVLGAKFCIVHPERDFSPEENAEKLYLPLLPYAKKYGVTVALENLWNFRGGKFVPCACSTAENYLRHLDLLDPAYFVACIDIGHAELLGDCVSAAGLIRALGSRLRALHVHDNDGQDDSHRMPYCGKIAWDGVAEALKETGYGGDLTFEVSMEHFPPSVAGPAAKLLHAIGRSLIRKIV